MNDFLTWEILKTYASFVTIVFMVVEFTKEIKIINKIPTRYWSFIISLILLIAVNLVSNTFRPIDIILYMLSSMAISLGSNGLSNFNEKKRSDKK